MVLSWLPLSLVKVSSPFDLADYVKSNNLTSEPAFNWWVKQTQTKRPRIINKFKTKGNKGKVKFGVKVPGAVEEALELDRVNGDKLWQEAITKEMNNSRIAFQVLDIND